MVNKVTLIGNLGRDVEMRRLENGSAVAKFSVATNESYKDKNNEWQTLTEWHDVICWRALAERAESQLSKGKLVYIEGKLTHRKFKDKEGIDRYKTEVVAGTFRLLERREAQNFADGQRQENNAVPSPKTTQNELKQAEDGDDLPF